MSTTPPPNPFEAFKAAYDQAAESWSKSMEQVLSSEDFAAAAGRMVARYADAQEALRQAAEATSDQLHLPTKDDLARVAELVLNVERKVDQTTDQLFEFVQSQAGAASAQLLTQISERLAALEAAFQQLARTSAQSPPPTPAPPAPAAAKTPPADPAPDSRARARPTPSRRAAPKE